MVSRRMQSLLSRAVLALVPFSSLYAQDPLWTVTRVIDGDTIHVQRGERREKLRLLNLDTEEKTSSFDSGKPQTSFGDQTAAYVKGLFSCDSEGLPIDSAHPPRVRLEYEGDVEERGNFGRLLCYVYLGDLNLAEHLIREGYSPYYTKYGFSKRHHELFAAAEASARERRVGIWNERTNAGGKRNDYPKLKSWWDTRARAMQHFERSRGAGDYSASVDGERKALEAAAGRDVRVFGGVWSITAERRLVRVELEGSADRPVQLVFPHDVDRTQLLALLSTLCREGGNDFILTRGQVVPTKRAIEIHVADPEHDIVEAPVGN